MEKPELKFHYRQKVRIKSGFYRGFPGVVYGLIANPQWQEPPKETKYRVLIYTGFLSSQTSEFLEAQLEERKTKWWSFK